MSLYRVHPQLSVRSLQATRQLCTREAGMGSVSGRRERATLKPQASHVKLSGWCFGSFAAVISAVNPEDTT